MVGVTLGTPFPPVKVRIPGTTVSFRRRVRTRLKRGRVKGKAKKRKRVIIVGRWSIEVVHWGLF